MQAETTQKKSTYSFLQGGGEMGALTRSYDWSRTSIGSQEHWSQTLKLMVSLLLSSKFPMFLWWGKDLIQFYNDAYRPSLGNKGKHPLALGQQAKDCWQEIWPVIKPLIDQVLESGESTWSEDQLIPIFRNGSLEDVCWTFSYSPVRSESGKIEGVLVICTETTNKVRNFQKLLEKDQRFQNLVRDATVGIIVLSGSDMNVDVVNEAYGKLIDRTPNELLNQPLFSIIPEVEESYRPILDKVRLTGESLFFYDQPFLVTVNEEKKEGYLNLIYQPYKENNGSITGVMVLCHDVTEQVLARKKIEESEHRIRSLIMEAPVPMCMYTGREMKIEIINEALLANWGRDQSVIGMCLKEAIPELEGQPFLKLLDDVYTTGVPYEIKDTEAMVMRKGVLSTGYYDLWYKPLFDAKGEIYGVLATGIDITEKVVAQKKLKESEQNLRNVFAQAPVGMALLSGPDFIIEIINSRFLELLIKSSEEVLGKPVFDVVPEVKGQGFEEMLKKVYITGETLSGFGVPVSLMRNGMLETVYVNFVYEAYREDDGSISGIMAVATEVTEEVEARKKLENSEARFRLMADSMPQFVWTSDPAGSLNYYNQAVYDYSGLSFEQIEKHGWLQIVHPDEREENVRLWMHSIENGKDFFLHHRFRNKNGEYRWQLSRAIPQRDQAGNIQLWIGTSTDIHEDKLFEDELNRQVKERTLELEKKNKELERSNANLEEFAHAASHDLKEPIRKIEFFTDRLRNQLSDRLSEEERLTFKRVENSSQRMGALIDDLLLYSHVSHRPQEKEEVDLNEKLSKVLEDLELDIQIKKATITIGKLPVIKGYGRQLQQLFQNVVGNALKYNKTGIAPNIDITSSVVMFPGDGKKDKYHLIEIIDNGIGFEQNQAEKIFQMFHRLHGNSEYRGTGVGLSIARKVAENHNGKILAESKLNDGATFRIYLPILEG